MVHNAANVGLAESRNIGVRASKGQWIAFLDDDDQWFPTKLEKQLEAARKISSSHAFVVSRFLEKSDGNERVWPETLPKSAVLFSEYLFCNRGMLLPSGFLVSRQLMQDVPFTPGLRHIEDIDWLLRAAADPRVAVGAVEEALFVYANHTHPGRESRDFPWEIFVRWGMTHRDLMTDRAFSDFVTRGVVPRAREVGASPRQLFPLLGMAFRASPRIKVIAQFLISSLFSREVKRKVRDLIYPSTSLANDARLRTDSETVITEPPKT
jgi:glycosyltransferase involved in cell wall biosynthesis